MKNHIYALIILTFVLFRINSLHSQATQSLYDVEGKYSVGKTSCTIEWSTDDRVFKVYWKNGIGNTLLYFKEELPNGNLVYEEYESNGSNYAGKFTFKDSNYNKGEYERADSEVFIVKRKSYN
jgi:hypothetical protein